MNRKSSLAVALFCTTLAGTVMLRRANADAVDEIKRLAAVMEWKPFQRLSLDSSGTPLKRFSTVVFTTGLKPRC